MVGRLSVCFAKEQDVSTRIDCWLTAGEWLQGGNPGSALP